MSARYGCIFVTSLILLFNSPAFSFPEFDHQYPGWNQMLNKFVQNNGVNYSALKQDQAQLDAFLESIASLQRKEYENWNKEQQIAFWVNAYNAITLKVIIDHYPLKRRGLTGLAFPSNSIRQIPGVWDKISHRVLEKETTLNEIEHEILRKQFQDPRIHFALVCASIGCPVLRDEPFQADLLDDQLDEQIRQFLATPEKFRYDKAKNTLYLSPIFKWFKKDFEQTDGIVQFIKKYVPENVASTISEKSKIEWLDYDWSLNERTGWL